MTYYSYKNILDIKHLVFFFIQILIVNNNKLFPIIFWIFTPFWHFFIQILMVNKDEFPKSKIFIFLEYWPNTFWNLQTCCKI
jgi:hypothetical protein